MTCSSFTGSIWAQTKGGILFRFYAKTRQGGYVIFVNQVYDRIHFGSLLLCCHYRHLWFSSNILFLANSRFVRLEAQIFLWSTLHKSWPFMSTSLFPQAFLVFLNINMFKNYKQTNNSYHLQHSALYWPRWNLSTRIVNQCPFFITKIPGFSIHNPLFRTISERGSTFSFLLRIIVDEY